MSVYRTIGPLVLNSIIAAPVAEQLRALFLLKSLDHLTAVSGVGSSPALAT